MKIQSKYLRYLFIFGLLVLVNQVFIQYFLSRKRQDAKTINIAGRQRMLSQKLNLYYYTFLDDPSSKAKLKETQELWFKSHYALLYGSEEMKLAPIKNGKAREKLNKLSAVIERNKTMITQLDSISRDSLKLINVMQAGFLKEMDSAVLLLEEEAQGKLQFVIIIEILLAVISLAVLYLEFMFLIRPLMQRLITKNVVLEKTNKKLEKAVFMQNHVIREPLTTIMMLLRIIKKEDDVTKKMVHLKHMQSLTTKIDSSIKEVNSFMGKE